MAIDITDATITPNPVDALAQFLLALGVVSISELLELTRFTASGTFNPANFPSEYDRYIIVIQGAGGGGGAGLSSSVAGETVSGGSGGGSGALLVVPFINKGLRITSFSVVVGVGGTSPVSSAGTAGGKSSFDKWIAPGGGGGAKGSTTTYGDGGSSGGYTGESGTSNGGGSSLFGSGGIDGLLNANGTAGGGYGAGGGGGGPSNTPWTSFRGGAGSNGLVIVYGWQ